MYVSLIYRFLFLSASYIFKAQPYQIELGSPELCSGFGAGMGLETHYLFPLLPVLVTFCGLRVGRQKQGEEEKREEDGDQSEASEGTNKREEGRTW